jgi:hypothetical protein
MRRLGRGIGRAGGLNENNRGSRECPLPQLSVASLTEEEHISCPDSILPATPARVGGSHSAEAASYSRTQSSAAVGRSAADPYWCQPGNTVFVDREHATVTGETARTANLELVTG